MNESFKIDYEWLPSDDGDASERATLASLFINVGVRRVTDVEDTLARSVRPSARLSALRLAEWFAANWWRLLWEPSSDTYDWLAAHNARNVGHGYVWPDLSFSSDWQSVHVATRPSSVYGAEPIRYLNRIDYELPISEFEKGVDDFVNGTIARLHSVGETNTNLSALWDEVMEERDDPDLSQQRALEACMGYDPDEAPSGLLDSLLDQMNSYGKSAMREVAAACKDQAVSIATDIHGEAHRNGMTVSVPNYGEIRARIATPLVSFDAPWRRAEHAAAIARKVWGVNPPISTEELCELLSIQESSLAEEESGKWSLLIAGFRDDANTNSDSFHVLLNKPRETSRRFDLARIVGDHIAADANDMLLPGTRCYTSRQKFQRAFAQEFLCPFDTLRDHPNMNAPDDDDIQDAADYFSVSPLMIQTTLVNKGVLHRYTLAN